MILLIFFSAEITVGFVQSLYQVIEGEGLVNLMLSVSGLLPGGALECPVDVSINYTDGPNAGKMNI